MKLKPFYDVIISGAGISGSTLAGLMRTSPYLRDKSILLIDKSLPKIIGSFKNLANESKPLFSKRIYAINSVGKDILEKLGSWEVICDNYRYWPADKMQTLDSLSSSGFTTFTASEYNQVPLAYFVEGDVVTSGNLQCLLDSQNSNCEVHVETGEISEVDDSCSSIVELNLKSGEKIATNLLVGAEGYNSSVRNLCNMNWYTYLYKHQALVGTLGIECPEGNHTAWQRFLQCGPIASLPLSQNASSLVLFADKEHLQDLMHKPEEEIVEILNSYWNSEDNEIGQKLEGILELFSKVIESGLSRPFKLEKLSWATPKPPKVVSVDKSSLATFPVGFGHAMNYVKPNVALVGDAAHRIHPLAGQGANLSLNDCQLLFNKIEEALKNGESPGKLSILVEYEREAQRHNLPIQLFCDMIYRIYGTSAAPVVLARTLAAQMVHNLDFINNLFVGRASFSNIFTRRAAQN